MCTYTSWFACMQSRTAHDAARSQATKQPGGRAHFEPGDFSSLVLHWLAAGTSSGQVSTNGGYTVGYLARRPSLPTACIALTRRWLHRSVRQPKNPQTQSLWVSELLGESLRTWEFPPVGIKSKYAWLKPSEIQILSSESMGLNSCESPYWRFWSIVLFEISNSRKPYHLLFMHVPASWGPWWALLSQNNSMRLPTIFRQPLTYGPRNSPPWN